MNETTGKRDGAAEDGRRCTEAQEVLRSKWIESSLGELEPLAELTREATVSGLDLREHVQECERCHDEAEALKDLDEILRQSLHPLADVAARPEEERKIDETLEQLREGAGPKLIQRLRRRLRLVLWTAFFGFSLLAACLLVIALYRAVQAP